MSEHEILSGEMDKFFWMLHIFLPMKAQLVTFYHDVVVVVTKEELLIIKNIFQIEQPFILGMADAKRLYLSVKHNRGKVVRLKERPFKETPEYFVPTIKIYPNHYVLSGANETYVKFKTPVSLEGSSYRCRDAAKSLDKMEPGGGPVIFSSYQDFAIKYRSDKTNTIKSHPYPIYLTIERGKLLLRSPYTPNATEKFLEKYPRYDNVVSISMKMCGFWMDDDQMVMPEAFWITGMELSKHLFPGTEVSFTSYLGRRKLSSPQAYIYFSNAKCKNVQEAYPKKILRMMDLAKYK